MFKSKNNAKSSNIRIPKGNMYKQLSTNNIIAASNNQKSKLNFPYTLCNYQIRIKGLEDLKFVNKMCPNKQPHL